MPGALCHSGGSRVPAIQVIQNTYSTLDFVQTLSAAGSEYLRGVIDSDILVHSFSDFFVEDNPESLNLVSEATQRRDFNRSLTSTLSLVEVISVAGGRIDSGPTFYEATYDSFGPVGSKGLWVYFSSTTAVLASHTSLASSEVCGALNSETAPGETAQIITEGEIHLEDWTDVAGTEFLSPGSVYYLQLNGQMRVTAPTSGSVVILGRAMSTTRFDIEISEPWVL